MCPWWWSFGCFSNTTLSRGPTSLHLNFNDLWDTSLPGRNSAFRRKILEIYDCQCAACGLRIRLPGSEDLTFVDAAHLIPFTSSFNDHPTNGIALCKNHHWAMDRFLIAPTPDCSWIVSPHLEARRSDGEKSLIALQGKRVLPPSEPAFAPARDALQWRVERLLS